MFALIVATFKYMLYCFAALLSMLNLKFIESYA